jgi:hypothetical protein
MASLGKEENLIDHRLCSKLYGLYTVLLKQGENLFIQGIGSGGDTDGIDQTRSEKGLNLF